MTDLLPWSGPGLWTGAELVHDSTLITTLSGQHVVEIDAAVEQTKARGLAIEDISQTDFPLPEFGMVLRDLLDELLNGRGFALIRGLPVERLSRDSVARDQLFVKSSQAPVHRTRLALPNLPTVNLGHYPVLGYPDVPGDHRLLNVDE